MIRFFIFTFLLNISLLNVNSSEKKNDDITFISKEEEDEEDEENVDNEDEEKGHEGNKENVCEEHGEEHEEKGNEEHGEEHGENVGEENEGEKLSENIDSNKIEEEGDLISSIRDDKLNNKSNIDNENNNCTNINCNFIDNNLNNEEENINENNIFIPNLNMHEIQENIDKNDDKESATYDKFDINKVNVKKGIKNDETDLSGLGRTKKEIKNEDPNCCVVFTKACCG